MFRCIKQQTIQRMINSMKSNQRTSAEYAAFEDLLKRVVQVPHSEIKAKIEEEKAAKKGKSSKTSASSRASCDKG